MEIIKPGIRLGEIYTSESPKNLETGTAVGKFPCVTAQGYKEFSEIFGKAPVMSTEFFYIPTDVKKLELKTLVRPLGSGDSPK